MGLTLVAWAAYELRAARPLVRLDRLRDRTILITDVAATVTSVAMYLFLPVVVEFVQIPSSSGYGFGASAALAGLCLLPMSLATAATSALVPRALERFGARRILPSGLLVLSCALLFFALQHAALWTAFAAMGVAGVGLGFSFGVMPGLIMSAAPRSESGSTLGLYQVLRSTGFATGSATCAAILAAFTRAGELEPRVGGYTTVLALGAVLCLAAALLALALPGRLKVAVEPDAGPVAPS